MKGREKKMGFEDVPRCQHVKVNGVQCGSPALRRKAHCYFHERVHYERKLAIEDKSAQRNFGFALFEDANSIQVALMKIVQLLGSGRLDAKSAGLMLYALQIASSNLRHVKFEPEKSTDIVVDEDTVDLTHINGPQWSSRDFSEEEKQKEKEAAAQLRSEPEPGQNIVVSEKAAACVSGRRERKRKLVIGAEDDGQFSLAKHLLNRMFPGWREDGFKPGQQNENENEKEEENRNEATATSS